MVVVTQSKILYKSIYGLTTIVMEEKGKQEKDEKIKEDKAKDKGDTHKEDA